MNIISKNKYKMPFKNPKKLFKLWHRRLGILAALFIILLSVTGIALNHTSAFNSDQQTISNKWLLDHYKIKKPAELRYYSKPNITVTDNLVWLDEHLLIEISEGFVIAAGKLNSFNVIVLKDEIFLYDQQGMLIDHLNINYGVPRNIQQVHFNDHSLIIKTLQGYWQVDDQFLSWQELSMTQEPIWALSVEIEDKKKEIIELNFRSHFLTLERVILDVHSGRIFGTLGVVVMDLAAIILILLAFSGLYLWAYTKKSKR